MKKWAVKPRLKLGHISTPEDAERYDSSIKRPWVAIGIVAAMAVVMTVPAVTVFSQAASSWGRLDGLFDLVSALFTSFWLLGWSVGLIILWGMVLILLTAKEVVIFQAGMDDQYFSLPGVRIGATYAAEEISGPVLHSPDKQSGRKWRGDHVAFQYRGETHGLGLNVSQPDAHRLSELIQQMGTSPPPATADVSAPQSSSAEPTPVSPVVTQSAPASARPTLASASTLALIGANLIPIFGALLYDWNLGEVMVIYWAESGIIGLYNLAKMTVIGGWLALPLGLFFLGHFGAFMAGHLLFIYSIFVQGIHDGNIDDDLTSVGAMFAILWVALAALVISHGISFYTNFLGRREYAGRSINKQMSEPYSRIMLMHVVIIFGGALSLIIGSPTPVLMGVILLKVVVDVRAHLIQRMPS